MNRRIFLGTFGASLLAGPLAADAQQSGKVYRVGLLGTATPTLMSAWLTAFREGLRERGYVEDQTLKVEYRWGEGKPERFPGLAAELVALITLGFVASLARPGRNITGLSFQDSDLVTRRLQLLKEAIPGLTRVAALWNPAGSDPTGLSAVKGAATSLGIALQILEVRAVADLSKAFDAAKQKRAQALIQLASPLFAANRKTFLDLSVNARLPATCQERTLVVDGCLMAYGPSFPDMFRRAAYYVDRIPKGANPADLPVEQATAFEFVINLKTARALGLTIPQSVLSRADQVIDP